MGPPYYSNDAVNQAREGDGIQWPPYYDGKLIISDFMRGWLQVVGTDAEGQVETITPIIHSPLSAPLDLAFGPDGALYVVEYGTNWFTANRDAYLSRIEYYAGDNPPPVAVASAAKTEGAAPLNTVLDGSGSFDRGNQRSELRYRWQVVENGKPGRLLGEQVRQPISLEQAGEQEIQLTVTDSGNAESSARLHFVVGNERPRVEISTTDNRSFFWDDGTLEYSVVVNDLEDGSTTDGSLPAEAVRVNFTYAGHNDSLAEVLSREARDPVLEGRSLLTRGSDCHACHQLEAGSIGPSFKAIAQRYALRADASAYLARVIAEGGSGRWESTHAMPAHPELSEEELGHAVAFIMSLSEDALVHGGDLGGTLRFEQHQQDFVDARIEQMVTVDLGRFYTGSYILHASYTDRGSVAAPPLQGSQTLVLRPPRLGPQAFDQQQEIRIVDVGAGVKIALMAHVDATIGFAYVELKNTDLSGIDRIRIMAAGLKPMMSGGPLELRLGSPDSAPVASVEVTTSLVPDLEQSFYTMDVSAVEGTHDLYFGIPHVPGGGDKLAYALINLEFLR